MTMKTEPVRYDANVTTDRPTFVTHLECSATGERHEADVVHGLSREGKPLLVRYDLDGVRGALTKASLADRPRDLWRWRELLPVRKTSDIVSLGECETPLIDLPKLGKRHGARAPIVKDEGRLPTGSFKARGLVMAVSMAKAFGIERIAMPTNGNAGAAMAAYCAKAGIEAFVFAPDDTPEINLREIALQGAKVWRVNGLIGDCGAIVGAGKEPMGWFDLSTLKEPYRIEGKKTMGYEIVEQLGWRAPDVILYPTGGGVGIIAIHKALREMRELGWLAGELPRLVAVQASGCAPIVEAFRTGRAESTPPADAHTVAFGITVPSALGDFLVLDAVRSTGGTAVAVTDEELLAAQVALAQDEGAWICPEGAACFAAVGQLRESGWLDGGEEVVVLNTGTGLIYPDTVVVDVPTLPRDGVIPGPVRS
jgi:threonine synthase